MVVVYVALETIYHPETREPLIVQDNIYDAYTIEQVVRETGMDNVKVRMCIAGNHAAAMAVAQMMQGAG